MRSSQIVHRPHERPSASAPRPGHGWLLAGGYVLELGPGLVAGTTLLERVRQNLIEQLRPVLSGLGAEPVALPASEGEALVNLLAHAGAPASEAGQRVYTVGAGWRDDDSVPEGLFGLALHDRLDVASVGAGPQPLDELLGPLEGCLTSLGLPGLTATARETGEPGEVHALECELAGAVRVLGRASRRDLAEPGGPGAAWLHLDLSAVLGALAEVHHDARGLVWPACLAPFDVILLPAGGAPAEALKLMGELSAAGVEVLLEDRALEPAEARAQAESWGLPWRLLFGPGGMVLESRTAVAPERVQAEGLAQRLLPARGSAAAAQRRRRLRAAY